MASSRVGSATKARRLEKRVSNQSDASSHLQQWIDGHHGAVPVQARAQLLDLTLLVFISQTEVSGSSEAVPPTSLATDK